MNLSVLFIISLFFTGLNNPTTSIETSDGGVLHYYNEGCLPADGSSCDIVIEKFTKGNDLEWKSIIGGNSWDYIESVLEIEDGFLVLGNTSSYGNGNLDVYLTKLDRNGKEQWFNTYGAFFNDYGRTITPSDEHKGYVIEGQKQQCSTPNVSSDCYLEPLYIKIDAVGVALEANF